MLFGESVDTRHSRSTLPEVGDALDFSPEGKFESVARPTAAG
jgi:hypothetical protein